MLNSTRLMYLRPGNLFKDFVVFSLSQDVTDGGRVVEKYTGDGSCILKGCLAEADDRDIADHSIEDHTVTHTIVSRGAPKAKRRDKLVFGSRAFYIVDIDDVGALGISTIYYAEERNDIK